MDGYYGPLNDEEWREQDGREPSNVNEAIKVIANVLDKVEDVWTTEYCDNLRMQLEEDEDLSEYDFCEVGECKGHRTDLMAPSSEIKAALVPWYSQIYGERYPSV